jgi:hypothetical protein
LAHWNENGDSGWLLALEWNAFFRLSGAGGPSVPNGYQKARSITLATSAKDKGCVAALAQFTLPIGGSMLHSMDLM